MTTCESIQGQLLPLLYDLLNEHEEKLVRDHLASCVACREAQVRAEDQRRMLAAAARMQFPGIQFTPPAPGSEPTMVLPRPRAFGVARWLLAASILLAIAGGIVGYREWRTRAGDLDAAQDQYVQAQDKIRRINDERNRYEHDVRAIQEQIQRLLGDWNEEKAKTKSLQRKQADVVIQGPKRIQPGAPNAYRVELRPQTEKTPAPKEPLTVRLINPENKQVLFEKQVANKGEVQIHLPASLPLKAGSNLTMEVATRLGDDKVEVREQVPVAPPLYVTHLATDRPMYRPGETIHFRSLTLERASLRPAKDDFQVRFRITAPDGSEIFKSEGLTRVVMHKAKEAVKGPDGLPVRGIAAGEFQLGPEIAGGEYTLHVAEIKDRFPPEKRSFLVNRYQAPRLNKEIQFTRKSYGPGEEVTARCKALRVEGGAVADQPIVATWRVDGIHQELRLRTDRQGNVTVKFVLPQARAIARGDASLSVQFTDGGNTETIVRPIPLVLKKLLVEFFAESGDLLADVPNRVYFRVQTPLNKPAELRGRIVDQAGKTVATVATLEGDEPGINQGLGVFQFVPRANQTYELKIDSPIGIEGRHILPAARTDGVVLSIPRGVVEDKIEVVLRNGPKPRRLLAGVYCRGQLVDHSAPVELRAGQENKLVLHAAAGATGVYRVTVFENPAGAGDDVLVPLAERLIFRRPVEKIHFQITPNKQVYTPGEPVRLNIKTTNEKTAPAPAILLVSVVDLSVLKLADEKTARTMPTHFYLTTEVQKPEDLECADFLLSDAPKAAEALDLLLGTQGWRRFAEQNPLEFLRKQPHNGTRYLALSGLASEKHDAHHLALEEVDKKYVARAGQLELALHRKQAEQTTLTAKWNTEKPKLDTQAETAKNQVRAAEQKIEEFRQILLHYGRILLTALLLAGGAVLIIVGLVRLMSHAATRGVVFLVAGCGLLAVLAIDTVVERTGAEKREHNAVALNDKDEAHFLARKKMRAMPDRGAKEKRVDALPKFPPAPPAGIGGAVKMEAFGGGIERAFPAMKPVVANELRELDETQARLKIKQAVAFRARQNRDLWMAQDKMVMQQLARREERVAGRRFLANLPAIQPFVVREYAHHWKASADQVRRDFTETLYWHPVLVLPDGNGNVTFDLPDSITRFQILAMGHTLDGRLGSETVEIASRLPYTIEPKVPVEVTSNDKVLIPVTVANDSSKDQDVQLEVQATGMTIADAKLSLKVAAGKRQRGVVALDPNVVEGNTILNFQGHFGHGVVDRVERGFKIVPAGFPIVQAKSDILEKAAVHDVHLPKTWIKGTLKVQVQVFPSPLADLQKGLEALLREPCGCFEQSSSSNYPNVLILSYLKENEQNRPDVEKHARQLLDRGYQRLTSFECLDPAEAGVRRGYEWFGQTAPPHEALTAYGLLQFRDMARFHPVEQQMMERTRNYLMSRRDGQGGFKRNPRAIDTFGRAPDDITNAYIVWALSESGGDEDLQTEIQALRTQAKESKDPYFLALVGNSLINRNLTGEAMTVLRRLVELQNEAGYLQGTRTSITGSGGRDLQIETTALAVLAWLKANQPEFQLPARKAIQWIGKQRGGFGAFGATQSTILALKALIAFARANRGPAESGELTLFVNDRPEPVARQLFSGGTQEPLQISVADENLFKPGRNKVRVEITGKNVFPHTLTWSYQVEKFANSKKCPVQLTARLDRARAREGETVHLHAVVENKTDKGHGMTVAILGLPGGLTVPEDFTQLKDMARLRDNGKSSGLISFWELRGRELVLYWRQLTPGQKIEVNLDLICRIPGQYHGPASRAYLYYNADDKFWVDPLTISIEPDASGLNR
jgi:hypothetical protein